MVSAEGILHDPRKVEAVRRFAVSEDLKTLRSFSLGLASYYRWFIQNFPVLAHPLFTLTRKDVPFLWTQQPCQDAFDVG